MPSKKACQGQPLQLSFGDDEISFIIWVPEAGVPRRTQGARLRYHCMRIPEKMKYSFSTFVFRETTMHAQNFETDKVSFQAD